jgi:hypothetical protein
VKKSWSRSIVLGAACAVALAGSLTVTSSATAEREAHSHARGQKGGITPYAYRANTFGTKVVVNGVELKTVKDAQALQKCTRQLRGEIVKGSSLGTDGLLPIGNDLIRISPSTSRTQTYHSGNRYGVRGINLIGDIAVGGTVGDIQTPVLKIEGLQSVADSFVDAGSTRGKDRYGFASDFGFKGISLEIPDGTQLPPEVQQLLEIVNQVATPMNQVVDQVVQLLVQVGGTIEIPGLGSLGLGTKHGKTTAHSAESRAYALKIQVNSPVDGSKTVVQLGQATSRISDPVPSGVFRTTMSALSVDVGDLLSFGGVSQTSIPCEGTGGRTRTKTIKAASVLGLVSLSDVQYSWSGKQFSRGHGKRKKDQAKGFVQTRIGQVSIPSAGLVINGLTSRVDMKSKKENAPVRSSASTSVGSITIDGTPTAPLQPGETRDINGGVIRYAIRSNDNFYGTENEGLQVILFQDNVVIDLANVNGQIFFR